MVSSRGVHLREWGIQISDPDIVFSTLTLSWENRSSNIQLYSPSWLEVLRLTDIEHPAPKALDQIDHAFAVAGKISSVSLSKF